MRRIATVTIALGHNGGQLGETRFTQKPPVPGIRIGDFDFNSTTPGAALTKLGCNVALMYCQYRKLCHCYDIRIYANISVTRSNMRMYRWKLCIAHRKGTSQ
ncbi:MAG: hypothetical protein JNG88_12710 [Phycisphaerales bacterium]|nr:hypothetical protein [Phycisphaerales bacterium]